MSTLWRTITVQMFMRHLKKVSAFERFCYKEFLRNSSGTKFFVRLREVSALQDVRFREVPLYYLLHIFNRASEKKGSKLFRHGNTYSKTRSLFCSLLSTLIPLISSLQKQPSEVFCKKSVLKNFAIFTGKHLCWSLIIKKFH